MRYPQVKFKVDPDQDYRNYELFRKYSPPRFLAMFLPEGLRSEMRRLAGERERNAAVKRFVSGRFANHRREIEENVEEIAESWRISAPKYFKVMDRVFGDEPWPPGEYAGFASVFNMYPRDVQDKIFYFPAFEPKHAQATVAHELTHFRFFEFIKRRYGLSEYGSVAGRGRDFIWNVSEVFNLTMEAWEPYRRIFSTSASPYTAMHARMQPRMRRLWQERQDVGWLLDCYFGRH